MSQPGSPRHREAQPMKSDPLLHEGRDPHRAPSAGRAGALSQLPQRVGARLLHELRSAVPPTLFFFVGFNFIVLTTNLLVADYAAAVSNFLLAPWQRSSSARRCSPPTRSPSSPASIGPPSSNRSCSRRQSIGSRCSLHASPSVSYISPSSTAIGRVISPRICSPASLGIASSPSRFGFSYCSCSM